MKSAVSAPAVGACGVPSIGVSGGEMVLTRFEVSTQSMTGSLVLLASGSVQTCMPKGSVQQLNDLRCG